MKYLPIFVGWALAAVVILTVATIEATHRSQDRTACYRAAKADCPKPTTWELWLARLTT